MKKWSALVLALVMMIPLLAGCGEQDPEKVAATVLAEVNGQTITKGEAQKVYDWFMPQTVAMNAQYYGITVDPTAKETITQVKGNTLNMMVRDLILEQKVAELGQPITEEDLEKFETDAQVEYKSTFDQFVSTYGMTEEEAIAAIDEMGYGMDALKYIIRAQTVQQRLRAITDAEVTVTEADITARYEEKVAESEAKYTETPAQYVSDFMNGTVYSQPEGIRYVKNLVVGLPEDIEAQINEKSNEVYNLSYEQYLAQNELAAEGLTEEQIAELDAEVKDLEARMTALEAEMDALKADALVAIKPEAEEILAKAKEADADFDALIMEYSVDQPTGDILEMGYPVHADTTAYVQSFTDGAMALENVGDVSDLIESTYGYHILQYIGEGTPGPVALEKVHDALSGTLLTEKKDAYFTEKETEWSDAAKVKTYINRF